MFEKVKIFTWLWIQCFKSMRNLKTFIPFLVYAVSQIFILYALINFVYPPFSSILVPIIRKLFGEPALHYPSFFLFLPPLYNQINILLSGVLGIGVIGVATHIFAAGFREIKPSLGQGLKTTISKYGVLFIIWMVEIALTLAMIIGIPLIINKTLQPEYFTGRLIELGSFLLGIVVASMFAYTTALIVLDRQKLISTISQSLSIFKRNPLTSFFLVAIPTFFYFPISFLTRKTNFLISKFSPEIIVALLGTGVLISFLGSYFQIGTITRFYLLLTEKRKW